MATTPTQRTMQSLRANGNICAVVEKFNPYVGEHGIRQDLFGIIDIIIADPERGIGGVQACAGSGYRAHIEKLTIEKAQESYDWLICPGAWLQIWSWRKLKLHRGGKAMRWSPKIADILLDEDGNVVVEERK